MNFRTDLALEAREILPGDPPGVAMRRDMRGDVHITRVEVLDETGERALGKPCGRYITLESARFWQHDGDELAALGEAIAQEIAAVLPAMPDDKPVLVVGLGNRAITADALGPQVAERVLVTRALRPEQRQGRFRPVCAFAPGVLGVTGIETFEAVSGLVRQVAPCMVIAVDALAARQTQRILSTVQIADTGISPGSGLGKRNAGLSRESLGVPVLAVGVPMVVYAATISWDTMQALLDALRTPSLPEEANPSALATLLGALDEGELEALVREVTQQAVGDLVVAPKEIDEALRRVATAIALGINIALHPGIAPEDMIAMQSP